MEFKFEPEVVNKLKKIPISEWGLLDNYDTNIMHNQMQFLADILLKGQPRNILEIGTNKGYFSYFASCVCPKVEIDTVDINPIANHGILILKGIGIEVNFHNSSSEDFFKTYNKPVDFAWVDGSHVYKDCLNDLLSCAKLNASIICVDDFRSNDGVFRAVFDFYKASNYYLHSQSYIMDLRGIICFTKELL